MTDYVWPDDLVPYAVSFYLQPHTGGSESPFNRASKIYGLGAPRWICNMSFRGGYNGDGLGQAQTAYGSRLDALIVKLKGRQNRIATYDFRRPKMRTKPWAIGIGNSAASAGDTSITITGLQPGAVIYNGDYIGGDGRPHIIADGTFGPIHTTADTSGNATVSFEPPLAADIALDAAIFGNPTGLFRLTDDDAGQNGVAVGEIVNITLNFVEDVT